MTTNNLSLYRLLLKFGANEEEAAKAAAVDASDLVTRAELRADLAELKADLTKTIWTAMVTLTVIFSAISAALRFVK